MGQDTIDPARNRDPSFPDGTAPSSAWLRQGPCHHFPGCDAISLSGPWLFDRGKEKHDGLSSARISVIQKLSLVSRMFPPPTPEGSGSARNDSIPRTQSFAPVLPSPPGSRAVFYLHVYQGSSLVCHVSVVRHNTGWPCIQRPSRLPHPRCFDSLAAGILPRGEPVRRRVFSRAPCMIERRDGLIGLPTHPRSEVCGSMS
ncbi:uncharacterized protein LY79DRAFT_553868, partial [Colletotrichum navitas]